MSESARPPPPILLRQLAFVMRASRALSVAAQLGIADALAGGPRTADELAATTACEARSLCRLLRVLVAFGVFEEEAPGRFRLNDAADLLRRGVPGSQRAGVLFAAGDASWRIWSDLIGSVRTGRSVDERNFGKNVFERHAENEEEAALFNEAMASFSASLSPLIIASYDFSVFGRIADIGGGTGRLLADILAANANVQGILFDLPNVVTGARRVLEASGVSQRCQVVAGDFLQRVPDGADAYILKHILHDWDDARASAILQNCRKAMAPGTSLLIVERVMPEKTEAGQALEAYLLDLEMLVRTPGGRERSEAEFRGILTHCGFAMTRVVPTSAPVSVIEAQAA
jgi:SAM-dependent methyltransferase